MAAMENDETKKSHARFFEGSNWLAENVKDVNLSFNQILKLIDQDQEPVAGSSDFYYERKPKLIAHVEDILQKHHLLAEKYDQLEQILNSNKSSVLDLQNAGDSMVSFTRLSCFKSPHPKSVIQKAECEGSTPNSSPRSDEGGSEISVHGHSDFSSLLSSDSDSESCKSSAKQISTSLFDSGKTWENNFVNSEKDIDMADMRERIVKYEEELRLSNQKLQFSEQQVARLKKEIEDITGDFKSQLESANCEIQAREAHLKMEKKNVLELQRQVFCLETWVLDSNEKVGMLEMELEASKEKLKNSEEAIANLKRCLSDEISDGRDLLKDQLESAQQEVALLETELDLERKETSGMQDKVQRYQADISVRDDEIKKLAAMLQDATRRFSAAEAELQRLNLIEARAEEWEHRSTSLEKELQQCEGDKTENQKLHEAQQIKWKNDLDNWKAEINGKDILVDLLNKDLDRSKLKYDELKAEKESAIAEIQTLGSELACRDNEIQQMKSRLHQLHLENVKLISAAENARKQYEVLRSTVQELEKEVESQNIVISDRAEEKREAIRQLCFSLEHYRSGYKELLQAYSGHKSTPLWLLNVHLLLRSLFLVVYQQLSISNTLLCFRGVPFGTHIPLESTITVT